MTYGLRGLNDDGGAPGSFFEVIAHYRYYARKACGIASSAANGDDQKAAASLFRNFVGLCLCFGLAQGAAMTSVTFAATLLGEDTGSFCDGFFFGAFTLASFGAAEPVVATLGSPRAYRVALLLFVAYAAALALAAHLHGLELLAVEEGTSSRSSRGGSSSGGGPARAYRLLAYFGSAMGGTGFALHWTAQSLMYADAARRYAGLRGLDDAAASVASGSFAGLFAAVYVPFEMACKQAAGLLVALVAGRAAADSASRLETGSSTVATGAAATATAEDDVDAAVEAEAVLVLDALDATAEAAVLLSVTDAFFCLLLSVLAGACYLVWGLELGGRGSGSGSGARVDEGGGVGVGDGETSALLGSSGGLGGGDRSSGGSGGEDRKGGESGGGGRPRRLLARLRGDKVLLWLQPFNVAFGLSAGFLLSCFYDETVARYRGPAALGLVSALGSAVCALAALPLSLAAAAVGKGPVLTLGSACLGLVGGLYLVVPKASLGSWGGVLLVNGLAGTGRSVWENTNKVWAQSSDAATGGTAFTMKTWIPLLLLDSPPPFFFCVCRVFRRRTRTSSTPPTLQPPLRPATW